VALHVQLCHRPADVKGAPVPPLPVDAAVEACSYRSIVAAHDVERWALALRREGGHHFVRGTDC
jgi:hypothetical protein